MFGLTLVRSLLRKWGAPPHPPTCNKMSRNATRWNLSFDLQRSMNPLSRQYSSLPRFSPRPIRVSNYLVHDAARAGHVAPLVSVCDRVCRIAFDCVALLLSSHLGQDRCSLLTQTQRVQWSFICYLFDFVLFLLFFVCFGFWFFETDQ